MKVDIKTIANSLFWWFPVYLDLDTGLTYNTRFHAEDIKRLKNKRRIPLYSRTPITQRYLEEARESLGIEIGEWFDEFPKFEFIPDYDPEEYRVFMEKAHSISESIYDPSFPGYYEYLHAYMIEFAKAWCKEEGYEWHE